MKCTGEMLIARFVRDLIDKIIQLANFFNRIGCLFIAFHSGVKFNSEIHYTIERIINCRDRIKLR